MSGNRGPCPCMRAGFWPLTILECPIHGDTRGHEVDRLHARVAELEAAAAGAERGSAQEAREHMRFQNAIEQRLREHGAGYETEPWFPDVIYGAAAAALAAAGAERAEEEEP